MLFHYQIRSYFLYGDYVDMRKGIDSLSGIVSNHLHKSPFTGDVFIFINRRRNHIKMLHWQGDGFALFYKRLEKGTYEFSPQNGSSVADILDSEQLLFLLQGVVRKSVQKRARYSHHFVDK
jgi:transposase